MVEDAALLPILVILVRVTVMDLLMEVLMMDMPGARGILCVAATIAGSLVCTSMKKMTAVIFHPQFPMRDLLQF